MGRGRADELHTAINGQLGDQSNAGLVVSGVDIGAQEQCVSQIIERRCRASVVSRHVVDPSSVEFGLGHDVCNL